MNPERRVSSRRPHLSVRRGPRCTSVDVPFCLPSLFSSLPFCSTGEIGSAADVKDASAVYWRLATRAPFHLLELSPETGRKHQLRIQCAQLLRAPVVGDFKYGYEGARVQGHLLHCATLRFFVSSQSGRNRYSRRHEGASLESPRGALEHVNEDTED